MVPKRYWRRGAQYWELYANLTTDRFRPVWVGVVDRVDGDVVRLDGTWRYTSEGLAFASRAEALTYAHEHRPSEVANLNRKPRAVRGSSPIASA